MIPLWSHGAVNALAGARELAGWAMRSAWVSRHLRLHAMTRIMNVHTQHERLRSSASGGRSSGSEQVSKTIFDYTRVQACIRDGINKLTQATEQFSVNKRSAWQAVVLRDIEALPVKRPVQPAANANKRTRSPLASPEVVHIRDIALLVVRGPYIHITLADVSSAKSVRSAISASKYALSCEPSTGSLDATSLSDAATLRVKLPPVTDEVRKAAQDDVKMMAEQINARIREARQQHQRLLRTLQSTHGQKIRPDDLLCAKSELDALVKKAVRDIKSIVDRALASI